MALTFVSSHCLLSHSSSVCLHVIGTIVCESQNHQFDESGGKDNPEGVIGTCKKKDQRTYHRGTIWIQAR